MVEMVALPRSVRPRLSYTPTRILLALHALWSLAGCGQPPGRATSRQEAAVPVTIECHTAYRSSVTLPIEREDQVTLTTSANQQTITYADLVFRALYTGGETAGEGRGLKLSVTLVESADELMAVLYQMPTTEAPRNQFSGGHGFTGLGYVYHPTSRAELQYWCITR